MSGDGAEELADAVAVRALVRCGATLALAAACLAVLALLFLRLSGGEAGSRSLPQLVVFGWTGLVCLLGAGGCLLRWRATRRAAGSGPGHAAAAARLVGRVVVAVPGGSLALAAVGVAGTTPRSEALLSAVVALAVVAQVALLAVVLRLSLRRAARLAV